MSRLGALFGGPEAVGISMAVRRANPDVGDERIALREGATQFKANFTERLPAEAGTGPMILPRIESAAAHGASQPTHAGTAATGRDSRPRSTMPRRNRGRFASSRNDE